MNTLAPICLFTYNRLEETKQTVKALQNNFLASESELYVFSDGPKNELAKDKVNAVRDYIKTIKGFKSITVFESKINKGLANSILDGVSQIINEFGKVIVLEDDLVTTPNFLDFMNQGLSYFKNNKGIYSISGFVPLIKNIYNFDFFLHERSYPWGWATWNHEWSQVNFNKKDLSEIIRKDPMVLKEFSSKCGEDASKMLLNSLNGLNNSWYIRWVFFNFFKSKLAVFPTQSLVSNEGFNSSKGTHCEGLSAYEYSLYNGSIRDFQFTYSKKNLDQNFLKYFTFKHKIIFRFKLLLKKKGAKMLFNELKNKLSKK